VAERQGDG